MLMGSVRTTKKTRLGTSSARQRSSGVVQQKAHEKILDITLEELQELWGKYINDSSLRSEFRFGQWVCNRKLPKWHSWIECYYASNEVAWKLLFQQTKLEKL
jgi:hypothetical protein